MVLKIIDRVVRRREGIEFQGPLDGSERHFDDARMATIVFTESAACVEKTTRLTELYDRRLIRLWIGVFLVLGSASRVAAECVLSAIETAYVRPKLPSLIYS